MHDTVNPVVFDGRPLSIEDVADIAHRRTAVRRQVEGGVS